jgi:hypothetical protein
LAAGAIPRCRGLNLGGRLAGLYLQAHRLSVIVGKI